jgi:hypothetical protein
VMLFWICTAALCLMTSFLLCTPLIRPPPCYSGGFSEGKVL